MARYENEQSRYYNTGCCLRERRASTVRKAEIKIMIWRDLYVQTNSCSCSLRGMKPALCPLFYGDGRCLFCRRRRRRRRCHHILEAITDGLSNHLTTELIKGQVLVFNCILS